MGGKSIAAGTGRRPACDVVDRQFADPQLASLYDACCPCSDRDDLDFYLPLVMAVGRCSTSGAGRGRSSSTPAPPGTPAACAGSILPTGCSRGARRCPDVEWRRGDLSTVPFDHEFDLIVMSGHAFQVWVDDDEIVRSLRAVRRAPPTAGASPSRPATRPCARGKPGPRTMRPTSSTRPEPCVRVMHDVQLPVDSDVVSFTTMFTSASWALPRLSHSTLRFLDRDALAARLDPADLEIEEQYGDWDRSPLTDTSPEIITIARATNGREPSGLRLGGAPEEEEPGAASEEDGEHEGEAAPLGVITDQDEARDHADDGDEQQDDRQDALRGRGHAGDRSADPGRRCDPPRPPRTGTSRSGQEVAGEVLPEVGGEPERLHVDALVVAVEPAGEVGHGDVLAEEPEAVGGDAERSERARGRSSR